MKGQEPATQAPIDPIPGSVGENGDRDRSAPPDSADVTLADRDAAAELRRRVLDLEAELRVLRALLDVRNEAFRSLLARLVALESREHTVHEPEVAELRAERDAAVELATVLQNMKIFRYSKWPRAAYGILRRLGRRG